MAGTSRQWRCLVTCFLYGIASLADATFLSKLHRTARVVRERRSVRRTSETLHVPARIDEDGTLPEEGAHFAWVLGKCSRQVARKETNAGRTSTRTCLPDSYSRRRLTKQQFLSRKGVVPSPSCTTTRVSMGTQRELDATKGKRGDRRGKKREAPCAASYSLRKRSVTNSAG